MHWISKTSDVHKIMCVSVVAQEKKAESCCKQKRLKENAEKLNGKIVFWWWGKTSITFEKKQISVKYAYWIFYVCFLRPILPNHFNFHLTKSNFEAQMPCQFFRFNLYRDCRYFCRIAYRRCRNEIYFWFLLKGLRIPCAWFSVCPFTFLRLLPTFDLEG